jgi:hypothetical protein
MPLTMAPTTWAALKRTFGVEVLRCPKCEGPMEVIACIEDEAAARRILNHLGLEARPPPRGKRGRAGQQPLEVADEVGEVEPVDPTYTD